MTLEAAVVVAVVMVVVQRLAVPLVHAFGGLVRNTSDSARFFTWCITPEQNKSNKTTETHYCNHISFAEVRCEAYIKPDPLPSRLK